jgi:uncharacterized Fe-S center protein
MILVRKELCPQNHPCPVLPKCPVNAITQQGFSAPEVDDEKCVCCCKCVKMCQVFMSIGCCEKGEDHRL